jgi:KipI family sensor histidine kinase inhibitor
MSVGRSRSGAEVVTRVGYDAVGYQRVVNHLTASGGRITAVRIRRVGTAALLLECGDADEVEAWRAELWRRRASGELTAVDIVPAAATVLVDGLADPAAAEATISRWTPPPVAAAGPAPLVEIPTVYDGEDLRAVAAHWGVDVDRAIDRLRSAHLRVAFCGFAPGFAYLAGLPAEWAVPRLASPRPRVPAGSIGLAGPYAGVYPRASPGGWRLVGHTDLTLFDLRRDPPALLPPGTRVRLVDA